MQYKNPLHIIRDKDLSSVSPENLKRWRKELMLRFTLGGNTTINVNGKEYDKQGVLDAFTGMEGDLSLHVRILENEFLLNFLEDGNLELFNDVNAFDSLNENGLFTDVKDLFITRLSDTLVKSYRKKASEAALQANKVFRFSEDMNVLDRNACFSGLYGVISIDVISLKLMVQNPFESGRDSALKSELAEYLNKDRHAFLKKLPTDFSGLRDQYGRAAYRMVYAFYQRRQDNFISLDMQTLEILKAGVDISFYGASANNLRWLKDKSKELEHIIKLKNKGLWGKYGEPLMYGCLIYIVVFSIIFFVAYGGGGSSNKSSPSNRNTGGIIMDSVIDDNYWSKCMLGLFVTKEGEAVQRELLFDEKGRGQASWKIKDNCRASRNFKWKVLQMGENENSELLLTYELSADSCLFKNNIKILNKERFPLAINWFQFPEGFKFGKKEFLLKQVDTSYLSQYPSASENLRLKIKRMEYLKNLQAKISFPDDVKRKMYSIISERDYSILSLNRKSGMSRSKIAEVKSIDKEPYLEFFVYGSNLPKNAVYFDVKNIRHQNRKGQIVTGDVRLYKTLNSKVALLGE